MAINLSKGQKISLQKETQSTLGNVMMGLGWDQKKPEGFWATLFSSGTAIDLDASCLMLDADKKLVDVVWFRQLNSKDGSIHHSGDNRTGAGEGDDEQIRVDLPHVPPQVHHLIFTINSFTGQSFATIQNAFCRLVDSKTGKEIARYNLGAGGKYTAQIMARLYRHEGDWKMHAIGEVSDGRTFDALLPLIQKIL